MTLRAIAPMQFPDIEPGGADMPRPRYIEVDPATLLVDETYQRNLSDRSRRLIRRLVAAWDWKAFKPPVVVETEDGLHVIDGQHTAIGAASHPSIETIPAQVVVADTRQARAGAFVKQNRDRIAISTTQLHHALVAAGDEDALTVVQVCERAGARVLKYPPANGLYYVGDILGVTTLRALINRRHAHGARRVLDICVGAKLAPVTAAAMRAVEFLLYEKEYAGQVADADLTTTLRELGSDAERQARLYAAEHRVREWRGLAIVLYRNSRKARRGRSEAA